MAVFISKVFRSEKGHSLIFNCDDLSNVTRLSLIDIYKIYLSIIKCRDEVLSRVMCVRGNYGESCLEKLLATKLPFKFQLWKRPSSNTVFNSIVLPAREDLKQVFVEFVGSEIFARNHIYLAAVMELIVSTAVLIILKG